MARQEINLGVLPNGVGGDTPRVANTKINDMTEELYNAIENGTAAAVKTVAGVEADAAKDVPKALLATALGVDDKADKAALTDKVDKVQGKGLSTNDFTTAEKTKLGTLTNLKEQGIGASGILVPSGDLNKALSYGNYAVRPTDINGNGVYGFLEVITYDSVNVLQRLTPTRGHPTGETSWFRSLSGNVWTEWRRYVFVGDFGVGSTSVAALTDLNTFSGTGPYKFGSSAANAPQVMFGTVQVTMYDATNWTQLVIGTSVAVTYSRSCVNGSIQPWMRINEESITNSNGTAVKFSDGTMICSYRGARVTANVANGPLFVSGNNLVTFAATFIDAPVVTVTCSDPQIGHCWGIITTPVNGTNCGIGLMSGINGSSCAISYMAVGRWR